MQCIYAVDLIFLPKQNSSKANFTHLKKVHRTNLSIEFETVRYNCEIKVSLL